MSIKQLYEIMQKIRWKQCQHLDRYRYSSLSWYHLVVRLIRKTFISFPDIIFHFSFFRCDNFRLLISLLCQIIHVPYSPPGVCSDILKVFMHVKWKSILNHYIKHPWKILNTYASLKMLKQYQIFIFFI